MAYVKMVTDSAADIPRALREELDIQVLPFPIAMGDKEYEDGYDFTPEEFYGMLLSAPQIPTHAQLNPYVFEQCFEQAYDNGYTHLIYTSINSKGSATHQNAVQAREEFYEEHPEARENFQITIIDSRNYTMTYGWAVVQGAKMAAVGTDPDKVVAYIQDWLDHVRVLFAPLDLRFAKKSGRVSAAAAFVGDALGLKPIMTFENGEWREKHHPRHYGALPQDPSGGQPLHGHQGGQRPHGRCSDSGLRGGVRRSCRYGLSHRRRHRHQCRSQPHRCGIPGTVIFFAAPLRKLRCGAAVSILAWKQGVT